MWLEWREDAWDEVAPLGACWVLVEHKQGRVGVLYGGTVVSSKAIPLGRTQHHTRHTAMHYAVVMVGEMLREIESSKEQFSNWLHGRKVNGDD